LMEGFRNGRTCDRQNGRRGIVIEINTGRRHLGTNLVGDGLGLVGIGR